MQAADAPAGAVTEDLRRALEMSAVSADQAAFEQEIAGLMTAAAESL